MSLSLITMWMILELLDVTFAGLSHGLVVAAVAIVFLSGNRRARAHRALHRRALREAAAESSPGAPTLPQ
ncbi:MAG: hypothetical protein ABL977_05780 [Candidatus Eisenbacteria bacterium]